MSDFAWHVSVVKQNSQKAHEIDRKFESWLIKNRYNPRFLPKNYFYRSDIWNIFGNKIFPVLSYSKFVWFFKFHPKSVWHGHASMPRKMLTGLIKGWGIAFLVAITIKTYPWYVTVVAQLSRFRGESYISFNPLRVTRNVKFKRGRLWNSKKLLFYLLFNLMILGNSEMVLLHSFLIST